MMHIPRTLSLLVTTLALATAGVTQARDRSPTCDELNWSARLLETNPDIRQACLGVYQKGPNFYAKIQVEVSSVRGNRLSFRTVHADGHLGTVRTIVVDSDWRANVEGRSLRPGQLQPGQRLSVYIPEDRFAMGVDNGLFSGDEDLVDIEDDDAANDSNAPPERDKTPMP